MSKVIRTRSRQRIRQSKFLQKAFKKFNRKYFGNQLPHDTCLFWNRRYFTQEGTLGECYHIRDMSFEKVKTGGQFISVRAPFISVAWETRKMGFGFSRTVLLHEMIHLHNQSADHGDDFDRERRRLMQYREIREILI